MNFFLCLILLSFSVYGQELVTISAEEFVAENPSLERKEIVRFITQQFNGKHSQGVTQKDLDSLWDNKVNRRNLEMIRFQIIDQKIYADSYDKTAGHSILLFKYFQNFIRKYKVKDVDFIIYISDLIHLQPGLKDEEITPTFLMSKDLNFPYETNKLLLPDSFMMGKAWENIIKQVQQANIEIAWADKISKVFWRGATSNGIYNIGNVDKLPRFKLAILSKLYPDLIDAQFTSYHNFPEDEKGESLRKILDLLWPEKSKYINKLGHIKYKYLASIDGNTCAWLRVPWIMLSNSVLLKQETSKIQWFYTAMKPYIHYVPLKEALTDTFTQIEWMKNHDLELQQISKNANNFVINNLMPEHIDAYVSIILNEYHGLQRDQKIIATLPSEDQFLSHWTLMCIFFNRVKDNFRSWIANKLFSR